MAVSRVVSVLAVCLCAAALAPVPATAWGTGEWVNARGTFFGRDAWSLHDGACGYGFVCPSRWSNQLKSGYDLVALPDTSDLYKSDKSSCGQCLEIQCRDATIKDGNGVSYDRSGSQYCKSGSKSVKVKVTDTCPCHYAKNAASNERWCCGDMPHLDVSEWAMRKIAKDVTKWGVFAIKYRTVACDATIENEAPNPAQLVTDPHKGDGNCSDAKSGPSGRRRALLVTRGDGYGLRASGLKRLARTFDNVIRRK